MTLLGGLSILPTRAWSEGWRRIWSLSLRAHGAALAVVLLALVPIVGTSASFSTDEGAAIVQARSLARGDGWIIEHPVPEVDPDGRHFPLELSERGPRGFVAFGKHPLYTLLLTGADRVAGTTGMVLLSIAGTVVAAGLAALLARRLDPSLDRPALWVVGLASPLLFDGFLVMAHTLGAALAAGALLAAVVALERRSIALAVAVAPLLTAAVLMRTEAVFLALGLAVAAGALAVRTVGGAHGGSDAASVGTDTVSLKRIAAVIAVVAVPVGPGAHVLESWWTAQLTGGGAAVRSAPVVGDATGVLRGRWQGLLRTVVTPTYGGDRLMTVLLLAMLAAIAISAYTVRKHPDGKGPVVLGALVGAGAAVLAVLHGPRTVIPGVLVAFPLATVGFVLLRRTTFRTTASKLCFGAFAFYALCVVASQYAVGGSTEWGGRFFALGLPLLVPVLLQAMREQAARVDRRLAMGLGAALVVCSLATATLAVSSLRHQHRRLGQLVALADTAGETITSEGEHRPVMVATYGSVPRWASRTFTDHRWLITAPEELDGLLRRLERAGETTIGLVTSDIDRDSAQLGSGRVVSSTASTLAQGWHVLVISLP